MKKTSCAGLYALIATLILAVIYLLIKTLASVQKGENILLIVIYCFIIVGLVVLAVTMYSIDKRLQKIEEKLKIEYKDEEEPKMKIG